MKKQKNTLAKRRSDTRKLYRFEEKILRGQPVLPIGQLRKIGTRIWAKHGKGAAPEIVAGRGDFYNGRLYSYYDGDKIVLARNERRKFVLVHEMVHALGHDHHDERFVRKYHKLLGVYNRQVGKKTLEGLKRLATRTT